MRKLYTILACVSFFAFASNSFAQNTAEDINAEPCPDQQPSFAPNPQPQALWDILYNYDLTAATSINGNAGVAFINNQFWVSRWQTDTMCILDASGNLVNKLNIAGGIRSITTNGTNVYVGTNAATITIINPSTFLVTGTIPAPVTNVRSLTYDPALPGFWTSTWATDISQIDMTGNLVSTVASASHLLTGMYGTAYDNYSTGGPYLWVFDQAYSAGASDIVQVNISTQAQTAIFHDVMSDVGAAAACTTGLAGGLFVRNNMGVTSIIGVLQGSPTNRLFAYDISALGSSVQEYDKDNFLSVYPNPATDMVNIHLNKSGNEKATLDIVDVLGNVVYHAERTGLNNYFSLEKYKAGIYFVNVICNGEVHTSKLIKQ